MSIMTIQPYAESVYRQDLQVTCAPDIISALDITQPLRQLTGLLLNEDLAQCSDCESE